MYLKDKTRIVNLKLIEKITLDFGLNENYDTVSFWGYACTSFIIPKGKGEDFLNRIARLLETEGDKNTVHEVSEICSML